MTAEQARAKASEIVSTEAGADKQYKGIQKAIANIVDPENQAIKDRFTLYWTVSGKGLDPDVHERLTNEGYKISGDFFGPNANTSQIKISW